MAGARPDTLVTAPGAAPAVAAHKYAPQRLRLRGWTAIWRGRSVLCCASTLQVKPVPFLADSLPPCKVEWPSPPLKPLILTRLVEGS